MSRANSGRDSQIIWNIYNRDGQPIAATPYSVESTVSPDGADGEVTSVVHQQTESGELHNPLRHQDPLAQLCACHDCQRPPWRFGRLRRPRAGLIEMRSRVFCWECGKSLCPRCAVRTGRRARCHPCERRVTLRQVARALFFRKEYL